MKYQPLEGKHFQNRKEVLSIFSVWGLYHLISKVKTKTINHHDLVKVSRIKKIRKKLPSFRVKTTKQVGDLWPSHNVLTWWENSKFLNQRYLWIYSMDRPNKLEYQPWRGVVSKYDQLVFSSAIFNKMDAFLNIRYDNAIADGLNAHNNMRNVLEKSKKKIFKCVKIDFRDCFYIFQVKSVS